MNLCNVAPEYALNSCDTLLSHNPIGEKCAIHRRKEKKPQKSANRSRKVDGF